jgi:hypothetical protein
MGVRVKDDFTSDETEDHYRYFEGFLVQQLATLQQKIYVCFHL